MIAPLAAADAPAVTLRVDRIAAPGAPAAPGAHTQPNWLLITTTADSSRPIVAQCCAHTAAPFGGTVAAGATGSLIAGLHPASIATTASAKTERSEDAKTGSGSRVGIAV